MLIQDITKILYDYEVDKKFKNYGDLVELTFYALDYVERQEADNYYKSVILSIVEKVCNMDKVAVEDKIELRDKVKELESEFKVEYTSFSELVGCLLIPKVERCVVVNNTLYKNSNELFDDFRRIVVKRSEVPKRHREKVYSYMYYVAGIILTKVDELNIEITEDDKDIIWILRQIINTPEFIDAYNSFRSEELVSKNESFGLYYRFNYNC